jgi:nitroreductase
MVLSANESLYHARYNEPDKLAVTGGVEITWPVPYWFVDAGMAVEHLLLGVTEAGLGACFFALFDHEAAVLASLGVPGGWRAVGTIAIGHPAPDRPGTSAGRPRRPFDDVVHRGRW